MTPLRAPFRFAVAGLTIAALAVFSAPSGLVPPVFELGRRHVKLVKSSPAAGGTVTGSPTSVRLWFSERVEISLSRVKLVDASGSTVSSGKGARIPGETDAAFMVDFRAPLPAGTYVVQWITATADGHPMKGDFRFAVRPRP